MPSISSHLHLRHLKNPIRIFFDGENVGRTREKIVFSAFTMSRGRSRTKDIWGSRLIQLIWSLSGRHLGFIIGYGYFRISCDTAWRVGPISADIDINDGMIGGYIGEEM